MWFLILSVVLIVFYVFSIAFLYRDEGHKQDEVQALIDKIRKGDCL